MNYDPEMNRYKGVDARTLGYVLNSNTPSNCLSENKLRSNRTQSCRVNARMRQQPPHQEECMSTQSGTELDIGCIGEPSLAMVYSPYQRFDMLYSASDALCRGTLFKELDKPLMIGGRRL